MKYTNNLNLDEPLFQALTHDDYHHDGDASVTELIKPPRVRCLEKRYGDKITIDAVQNLWSLLGKVGHKVIERHEEKRGFQEERLYLTIFGWKIAAKLDLWVEPHFIKDYKYTTIWSYIFGLKPEWIAQLNCYAPFYIDAGFDVKRLQVVAIFRDHQLSKQKMDKKYPRQIEIMEVPFWDIIKIHAYLFDRITFHQESESLSDNDLPFCTPEERWEKATTYAVMKKGRKSSLKNFDNEQAAYDYQACQNKDWKTWVEKRPGKSPRCEDYCYVKDFCNQYQDFIKGG